MSKLCFKTKLGSQAKYKIIFKKQNSILLGITKYNFHQKNLEQPLQMGFNDNKSENITSESEKNHQ